MLLKILDSMFVMFCFYDLCVLFEWVFVILLMSFVVSSDFMSLISVILSVNGVMIVNVFYVNGMFGMKSDGRFFGSLF